MTHEGSHTEVQAPKNVSSSSIQVQTSSKNFQKPYFPHHNDTSNLVLISDLHTNDNYITWSSSMILALSIHNKLGFADGTLTEPTRFLLPV